MLNAVVCSNKCVNHSVTRSFSSCAAIHFEMLGPSINGNGTIQQRHPVALFTAERLFVCFEGHSKPAPASQRLWSFQRIQTYLGKRFGKLSVALMALEHFKKGR